MIISRQTKLFAVILSMACIIQNPTKSYSKYYSVINQNNSSKVASFVFLSNTKLNVPLVLNEKMYPGINYEYNFVIKNFEDDKKSDVSLRYSLSVEKTNNLPINVTLYKDNIEVAENKVQDQKLNINEETTDNYTIKISWDSTLNDYKYASLSDNISLLIDVVQVD